MIVYKFDVLTVLKGFGYTQYKLRKDGLLSASAVKALRDGKAISFDSLDTLCRILHMNVADIIEYKE